MCTNTGASVEMKLMRLVFQDFDAVVVATGHYHVPYIPNFPGLSQWQSKWPNSVSHSKSYRVPEVYDGKVGIKSIWSSTASNAA